MATLPILGSILLAVSILSVADPDFTEREVVVGSGEWSVPGVLTLPAGRNARAAAVLLHGSGPGPADNLKEEAHGLARRGVATLRYTKRPTAHAASYRALGRRATLAEEHIDDAVLATELLKRVPEVARLPLFVIGHSQSTAIAPLVAERVAGLSGIVLVAASSRAPADMIESQVRYVGQLPTDSAGAEDVKRTLAAVTQMRTASTPDTARVLGLPMSYWRELTNLNVFQLTQSFLAREGRLLVIHGGRDYLVTDADFDAWKARYAHQPLARFIRFAELNHMMQAGEGRMTPAEYSEGRPLFPAYLDSLSVWMQQPGRRSHSERGRKD